MQQISNNEWIQWKGEEKSFQQISGDFETIEDSTAKTILSCFHETTSSKKKKKKGGLKIVVSNIDNFSSSIPARMVLHLSRNLGGARTSAYNHSEFGVC